MAEAPKSRSGTSAAAAGGRNVIASPIRAANGAMSEPTAHRWVTATVNTSDGRGLMRRGKGMAREQEPKSSRKRLGGAAADGAGRSGALRADMEPRPIAEWRSEVGKSSEDQRYTAEKPENAKAITPRQGLMRRLMFMALIGFDRL